MIIVAKTKILFLKSRESKLRLPESYVNYNQKTENAALNIVSQLSNTVHSESELALVNAYGDPKRVREKHTVSIVYSIHLADFTDLKSSSDIDLVEIKSLQEGKSLFQNIDDAHQIVITDYLTNLI